MQRCKVDHLHVAGTQDSRLAATATLRVAFGRTVRSAFTADPGAGNGNRTGVSVAPWPPQRI
jgi:hypothetical protein